MANAYSRLATAATQPQSIHQPQVFRSADMVRNEDGGGYYFPIDKWEKLRRFLILGTEGGTFYAAELNYTEQAAKAVVACIKEDGEKALFFIRVTSELGLAPKNSPAIFALALACAFGDERTKRYAYQSVKLVCRTGSHLFEFVEYVNRLRGWSRGLRRAVANWYQRPNLEYQLVKYRQRNGWTHKDVFRLAHPQGINPHVAKWVMTGEVWEAVKLANLPENILIGYEAIKNTALPGEAAELIAAYRLPWEAVPSYFLNNPEVLEALIPDMGYHALLRQYSRLSAAGMLEGDNLSLVASRLLSRDAQARQRVHPFAIWMALNAYAKGRGRHRNWRVLPKAIDLLNDAFDLSFHSAPRITQPIVVAVDVSGSMGAPVSGDSGITCAEAAAAMAYCQMRLADDCTVISVSNRAAIAPVSRRQRLDDFVRQVNAFSGGTSLSQVIRLMNFEKLPAEMLVMYTDNEQNQGVHCTPLLRQRYPETVFVVAALAGLQGSIADPQDGLSFNVVGLDASLPYLLGTLMETKKNATARN